MKKNLDELRYGVFADFYSAVLKMHTESKRPHRGHGPDHDITVAQIALKIAPDDRTAEKAWCAAMLHSMDRMIERNENKEVFMKNVSDAISRHVVLLPAGYFTTDEEIEIWQAALRHAELNQNDQSVTQQVLMDADRLANLLWSVIVRAGQCFPELPAFDFKYPGVDQNPASTYAKPETVFDDLRNNIACYVPQLRLPLAKELAVEYVAELQHGLATSERQNQYLGLVGISLYQNEGE